MLTTSWTSGKLLSRGRVLSNEHWRVLAQKERPAGVGALEWDVVREQIREGPGGMGG